MTAPALPRSSTSNTSSGDTLTARLSAEQSSLRARTIGALVLGCVGVIAVVAAVGTYALSDGRWMTLPRFTPVAIWLLAAAAVFVARRLYTNDARRFSLPTIAGVVEREQKLRDGSLRGALEVASSGVLGARAAQDVAKRLTPATLAPEFARELTKSLLIAGVAALFGVAVLTGIAQFRGDGFAAVAHPVRAWRGTLLPALAFEKLPTSVPRGMPLTVRMRAEGRQAITVSQRAEGEAWRDTVLSVSDLGVASLALGPVRAPVTLRVNDGRAPAAEAVIAVDERGWIGDVALFAEYPSYLARTNETLEPVSPVRVPRGTRVRVTAVLRGGARDAALSDGAQSVPLVDADDKSGEGTRVSGVLSLDHDGAWKWSASATPRATGETLPPELPDSLSFVVVPDKAPEVMIASPQSDTAIGVVGTVPVIVRTADDHAVRHLVLTLWREPANADKNDKTAAKREQIDIGDPASPFFEGGVTVPLDNRGLEPGDRVHLVAIATDDSPWRQQTASAEVILRVPTLSEQRSMARSLADSLAARALQMAAQEKRMQQNTADAARSRDLKSGGKSDESNGAPKNDGAKSSMSFQAAEKARQMAREQQQMGAKIDSLRQSAKELENRLKSANALDTALAGRMRDIQKMLRDAMTPEMQKQLEALNKSSERLSGTEAQQSMEQLAQQQQQLRQQLDKSAEMLKRAALEGSMSTLRDEAKELADAQRQLADKLQGKPTGKNGEKVGERAGEKSTDKNGTPQNAQNAEQDPKALAERSRQLKEEVDKLAKRLDEAGAKPGANKTRAAQPMVDQAADAMDRAAQEAMKEAQQNAQKNEAGEKPEQSAMDKALQALKDEKDKSAVAGQPPKDADSKMSAGEGKQSGQSGEQKQGAQQAGKPGQGQQSGGQQQGQGQQQAGQQGQPGQQGGQRGQGGQKAGDDARQAGDAMDKAAQQLAAARESQVDAWKTELSEQLDQSINETMQLARQQADLEQRARQGGNAQQMQGEQGALQQGVQQAAERLEKAGRSSSLLSQRSQKAMADAQRRVQQATQQAGQPQQAGGNEQTQNAMKDATEALNQALSSLVRDREKVNNAQSASGFTEMMEQLKQLAQKQGSLNGQMQGLNMLPGGAQGDAAKQQSRVLARQQRDVAKTLTDVSDADQTGRTDALAKEAQMIAQQIERAGIDPSVAARQQQLYRRLLDAGRFLEQDERDDQGPREAKTGSNAGARGVDGPQSGKAANKYAPPAWNDLRGLGPEERRLVIEYFRRLNGSTP